MEDNEITHSVENRSLKAVNNNPIEPIKALSKKVIHPGYEDNNFRTFCKLHGVGDSDVAKETGFNKSYINRIKNEKIKIIDATKIKVVRALMKLTNSIIMVEAIFPGKRLSLKEGLAQLEDWIEDAYDEDR